MQKSQKLEVWLRGPLDNIPSLLQPAAHALLQAQEEVNELMNDFPDKLLWERPANVASPAFHLQHLSGVLDRLFTYAANQQLTETQLDYLSKEGKFSQDITTSQLLRNFNNQIDNAIKYLSSVDESTLNEPRGVGRAKIPSTVLGLLFHAAEHTQRHTGQLLVTVKVIQMLANSSANK
jgi:uncharacterized damage-inducible protein DinB